MDERVENGAVTRMVAEVLKQVMELLDAEKEAVRRAGEGK